MAPDDAYTTGGGKLKLKGSKDGRIEKKKKKKSKPKPSEEPSATEADDPKEDTPSAAADRKGDADTGFETALASPSKAACLTEIRDGGRKRDDGTVVVGKTEAEKKHEEQRRKRVRPPRSALTIYCLRFYDGWLMGVR